MQLVAPGEEAGRLSCQRVAGKKMTCPHEPASVCVCGFLAVGCRRLTGNIRKLAESLYVPVGAHWRRVDGMAHMPIIMEDPRARATCSASPEATITWLETLEMAQGGATFYGPLLLRWKSD